MVGPPTFFVDLMDDPAFSAERVDSLRLVSSGGAGVAKSFVERATRELGALVKRSYGSTEAPTVATSVATDDPALAMNFDGHAIGEAQLRIERGELQVRGPELFAGYLSSTRDRAGDDRGRVVPHGRPGRDRRSRLVDDHGPRERHHHSRRREHLGTGGRGSLGQPSRRVGGHRRRRASHPPRRASGRHRRLDTGLHHRRVPPLVRATTTSPASRHQSS